MREEFSYLLIAVKIINNKYIRIYKDYNEMKEETLVQFVLDQSDLKSMLVYYNHNYKELIRTKDLEFYYNFINSVLENGGTYSTNFRTVEKTHTYLSEYGIFINLYKDDNNKILNNDNIKYSEIDIDNVKDTLYSVLNSEQMDDILQYMGEKIDLTITQ